MTSWQNERWKVATSYPLKLEYEASGRFLLTTRGGGPPRKDGSFVGFRTKRDAKRALAAWHQAWNVNEYDEASILPYFRNGE